MELESIMLSEISQAVKDKYRVISPISGTQSTRQTRKENINRNIEIKNKLMVARGEGEEGQQGKEREGASQGT